MSSAVETSSPTSTPPVIDLDAILAPVAGDNPAGESQQYTGLYDEIREARRADDLLEQGEWKREPKVADWVKTASLAADALSTQTKDLQICAWMTEALIKLYGFPGLRDGLKTLHGFHESFWDNLYPEEDEGDLEARANAISWLDRQAAVALREVPLTRGSGGAAYNFNDWEQSNQFNVGPEVDLTVAEERRQRAAEEGKVTSEDWLKAKQTTPRAFYETTFATLEECWATFRALDSLMDERFGRQAPGMGELKKSLEAVRDLAEKLVKEKRMLEPDALDVAASGDGASGDGASSAAVAGGNGSAPGFAAGPIRTRQEAINRLAEVAAFFRQTEPHNPVAYLIERAIRWNQMPLETWLASVIKDSPTLDSLRETLGVESPAE